MEATADDHGDAERTRPYCRMARPTAGGRIAKGVLPRPHSAPRKGAAWRTGNNLPDTLNGGITRVISERRFLSMG